MAKQRTDTESVLKLVINGQQAKTSVKELRDTYFKLNTELNNMRKNDDPRAYAEKTKEVQRLKNAWDDTRKEIAGTTKNVKSFNASFADIAKGVFGGNMLTRAWDMAVQGINTFISKNAELSDQMAGVIKTTGLNEQAVDRLMTKFNDFDTRTARSELLGLAQVAGKLGYSAENDVEAFVRAADKIGVSLGEDLGGTEAAINSIGKLVDIFQVSDTFGLEESLLKVGSAINELGASGSAKESYLIDFTQRLAGIAPAADIVMTDVLGLAATLDELGQQVESSSTAVGQFIVKMGADVDKFAKIVGISVDEFSKLLKEDANEAFLRVLEASNSAGGGIEKLAENMGLIEVAGARGIAALGVLSGNVDKLREKQDLASASFDEGTSILTEFNNVNTTLGANLEKIGNRINDLWQNSKFRNWLTDVTASMVDMTGATSQSVIEYRKLKSEVDENEKSLNPLISRYEELKGKNELSNDEHIEFRDLIDKISTMLPSVVTEFDKYGKAIDINTGKIREMTKAQRELLQLREKEAIDDLVGQFRESYSLAQQRSDEANITLQGGRVYNETIFGLQGSLKSVEELNEEAKLAMGDAYDAAVKLRDEFGFKLAPEAQKVVNLFEKVKTSSREVVEDDNEDDEPTVETGGGGSGGGSATSEKKKVDAVKKEQESLKEFLAKNANDVYLNSLDADRKELESIRLKYQEKRKLAHGDTQLLNQLAGQQIAEVNDLGIKRLEKEKELENERLKKKKEVQSEISLLGLSDYDLEIEREKRKYAELIALAEKYGLDITEIVKAREASLLAIETAHKDKAYENELEKVNELREFRIETAQVIASAVFDIFDNNRKANYDAERAALEKERQNELSNKNLTEAQKQAINQKYDQKNKVLKLKEFKADQRAAIAEAFINMALGIGRAIPNPIKMKFAAASGLAQIAVIASQKPPQYAKGGFIPEGPSHAHGGIDLWDRRRQQVIGNIEGGEPILSKQTYANNKQIIDELLYSSQRKAGASIQLNPDIINSERMVRNGGMSVNTATPVVNVSSPGVDLNKMETLMNEMIIAQREANDKQVILSTRLLEEENNKQIRLRNSVNA